MTNARRILSSTVDVPFTVEKIAARAGVEVQAAHSAGRRALQETGAWHSGC